MKNYYELTLALLNELNKPNYKLSNFNYDSSVLVKLLKKLKIFHLEENLTTVEKICLKETQLFKTFIITPYDKKMILKYL